MERELPKVPFHIPIIILVRPHAYPYYYTRTVHTHTCYCPLSKYAPFSVCLLPLSNLSLSKGNFRDLGEHRAIMKDEVIAFVESLNR